ncbi:MAG TPA: hypothetical protein VL400_16175 [Polyangiaceae bacterium]|jgi:hypothetical protein|nr:hypothetical protein [Polyangiaceae bacterium]
MERVLFFASVLVLGSGCAVDGIDTIFGNSGAGGGDGSGGAAAQQSSTTDGQTSATDGSTSTSATTTSSTTTSTSATTAATTGVTTGGNTGGITVYCNGSPCDEGDVCCFDKFTAGQDFCSAPGTCPDGGEWTEIACNGPDDCNGGQCCGKFDPQQGWTQIECKQSCGSDTVMCGDDPLACDLGDLCHSSASLGNGYGYCGN